MLSVVAVADAKVPVVEDHGVDPGRGERLRISRHHDLSHVTPAAGQYDGRLATAAIRPIEPSSHCCAFGLKFDVESFHWCSAPCAAFVWRTPSLVLSDCRRQAQPSCVATSRNHEKRTPPFTSIVAPVR